MKAIITYGNYFNFGKHYQVKFIYENEQETEVISSFIEKVKDENEIKPYNGESKFIRGTNIPKNKLLLFIGTLVKEFGAKVVIRNQEFTTFDLNSINEAIDKLHVNATIDRGKYFNLENTYYVTFDYATEEQKEEIAYDFNCRLKSIIGEGNYVESDNIFPFSIDSHGNITSQNTGIIGGTNIPTDLLPFFIKRFAEELNMVITIGENISKSKTDCLTIIKSLENVKSGKIKIRRRKQGVE